MSTFFHAKDSSYICNCYTSNRETGLRNTSYHLILALGQESGCGFSEFSVENPDRLKSTPLRWTSLLRLGPFLANKSLLNPIPLIAELWPSALTGPLIVTGAQLSLRI